MLEADRNTSSVLLRMPGGAVGEVYLERDRETWLDLAGFSDARQIFGSPPCTLGRDNVLACGTHSGTETLAGVARAARGEGFTCAVLLDATVACWGRNDFGQLAVGGPTSDEARPVVRLDPDDHYRDASYDPPPRGWL
jgi:alpha-tubulin suppressor-like RCC1 family protein